MSEIVLKSFTKKQLLALAALERALQKCAKSGLQINGMDRQLLAYRDDTIDELMEHGLDHYDALSYCNRMQVGQQRVNSFGAYKDSGGW